MLDVAWNGFGREGGVALASGLAANETLRELDSTGNRLDDRVAVTMATSLETNETLRVLKVMLDVLSIVDA